MNFCSDCGATLLDQVFCPPCGTVRGTIDSGATTDSIATSKTSRRKFLIPGVVVLALAGGIGAAGALGGDKSAYGRCMANYKHNPTLSIDDKADLCRLETSTTGGFENEGYSDTEGYYEQPQTCLEWKTNYAQRYVHGTVSNGASTWNGSSWVHNSPGTPGHWEQYPTGQTCVRYG